MLVRLHVILLAVAILGSAPDARAINWKVTADPPQGLPTLTGGGVKAMTAGYVFWKKNWAWSGLEPQYRLLAPFEYSVAGRNPGLDFDLTAIAKKLSGTE